MSAPATYAAFWPQGTCPKPWVALVGGLALRDARNAVRRFSSKEAAEKAALTTWDCRGRA
jgi:hypothetical protein